jgi:hypothetical protein
MVLKMPTTLPSLSNTGPPLLPWPLELMLISNRSPLVEMYLPELTDCFPRTTLLTMPWLTDTSGTIATSSSFTSASAELVTT